MLIQPRSARLLPALGRTSDPVMEQLPGAKASDYLVKQDYWQGTGLLIGYIVAEPCYLKKR